MREKFRLCGVILAAFPAICLVFDETRVPFVQIARGKAFATQFAVDVGLRDRWRQGAFVILEMLGKCGEFIETFVATTTNEGHFSLHVPRTVLLPVYLIEG